MFTRSTDLGAHVRPKPARWRRHQPGTLPGGLALRAAAPLLIMGSLAGGAATVAASLPAATPLDAGLLSHRPSTALTGALSTSSQDPTAPGTVEGFGSAPSLGGPGPSVTGRPVGVAGTATDQGYWVAAADGGVFAYGDAAFHGSMGSQHLDSPIVGMAATPDGGGYWLVAADGGIFAFGDAAFRGSMGSQHLDSPVVGMASTPDGNGYWLVAADGGIFAFGDASFYGSMGATALASPIVGVAPSSTGRGYWLAAADGGIFAFGDAGFHGSLPSIGEPSTTVTAIAATTTGTGYWLVEGDGAIYAFGDATYEGAPPVEPASTEVVGLAPTHQGAGYWEATSTVPPAAPTGTNLGAFVVTCYDDHGITASGAYTNAATVSVDPSVIPMGSTIDIQGVGARVAQDTGSAIKGHRLDIWEPSAGQCTAWGVQTRNVILQG